MSFLILFGEQDFLFNPFSRISRTFLMTIGLLHSIINFIYFDFFCFDAQLMKILTKDTQNYNAIAPAPISSQMY